MPLDKPTIVAEITALFNAAEAATDPAIAKTNYISAWADVVIHAIESGDVQFPIAVTVDGGTHQGATTVIGKIL